MAQTTGKMNGTDLGLYVHQSDGSEVLIASATECTISFSEDPRDTTTKDSGGWRELAEGLRSATISASYLHAEDDTNNIQDYWGAFNTRANLFFLMSTEETGDYRWNGECRITSLEKSAATEDNVTYSVTREVTGEPVYELNS